MNQVLNIFFSNKLIIAYTVLGISFLFLLQISSPEGIHYSGDAISYIDMHHDFVENGHLPKSILFSPLYPTAAGLISKLLNTEVLNSFFILNFLCSLISYLLICLLANKLFKTNFQRVACILLFVSAFWIYNRFLTLGSEALFMVFYLSILYIIAKFEEIDLKHSLLIGTLIGISYLIKYNALVFMFAYGLYLLLNYDFRKSVKLFSVSIIPFVIIFFSWLFYNRNMSNLTPSRWMEIPAVDNHLFKFLDKLTLSFSEIFFPTRIVTEYPKLAGVITGVCLILILLYLVNLCFSHHKTFIYKFLVIFITIYVVAFYIAVKLNGITEADLRTFLWVLIPIIILTLPNLFSSLNSTRDMIFKSILIIFIFFSGIKSFGKIKGWNEGNQAFLPNECHNISLEDFLKKEDINFYNLISNRSKQLAFFVPFRYAEQIPLNELTLSQYERRMGEKFIIILSLSDFDEINNSKLMKKYKHLVVFKSECITVYGLRENE